MIQIKHGKNELQQIGEEADCSGPYDPEIVLALEAVLLPD